MNNKKPLSSDEEIVKIWYFKKFKPLIAEADIMKAMHYEYKHSYDYDEVLEILKEARKQAEKKLEFYKLAMNANAKTVNVIQKQLNKAEQNFEQACMIIEDIKKITGCESNDSLDIVESVEKYVKTVELQGNENVSFIKKIRELEKQLKEASSETKEDFEHEKIITEFADDSTKRLMKEIENLKQRLKEANSKIEKYEKAFSKEIERFVFDLKKYKDEAKKEAENKMEKMIEDSSREVKKEVDRRMTGIGGSGWKSSVYGECIWVTSVTVLDVLKEKLKEKYGARDIKPSG